MTDRAVGQQTYVLHENDEYEHGGDGAAAQLARQNREEDLTPAELLELKERTAEAIRTAYAVAVLK